MAHEKERERMRGGGAKGMMHGCIDGGGREGE